MRPISLFFILFFCGYAGFTQVTNIKEGNWSDNTIWSDNVVPTIYDDIVLEFDIVIDINASCQSLITNGNNVTIKAGVNFNILGNANDTLLSRYIVIDTMAFAPLDTAVIIDFSYDNEKRNTAIHSKFFDTTGILAEEYDSKFFYNNNSRLPFKKSVLDLSPGDQNSPSTTYYFYQNSALIEDSTVFENGFIKVRNIEYQTGLVITKYIDNNFNQTLLIDTIYVQYSNGNLVKQTTPDIVEFNFVYDDHPNPFYHTQNKTEEYPLYSHSEVNDISQKNNLLSSDEYSDWYTNYVNKVYEYKSNGYPKTVSINSFTTYYDGKGFYFYTH